MPQTRSTEESLALWCWSRNLTFSSYTLSGRNDYAANSLHMYNEAEHQMWVDEGDICMGFFADDMQVYAVSTPFLFMSRKSAKMV